MLLLSIVITAVRRVIRPTLQVYITAQPRLLHHGETTVLLVALAPAVRRSAFSIGVASGERAVEVLQRAVSPGGDAAVRVPTGPLLRGVYHPERVSVSWYDPLSLTRLEYRGASDDELVRVFPDRRPVPPTPDSRGARVRYPDDAISLERNTELTEARPYHPGDDPRRIHWGMYAHTGDLFVRIGDEIPPPTGDRVVAVDLTAAETPEAVDTLTALALGLADRAAADGEAVSLCLLEPQPRWYGDATEAEWDFARLQPQRPGAGGEVDLSWVDILVTGGVSRYAPHHWQRDAIGVVAWRKNGVVPVFTVDADARS